MEEECLKPSWSEKQMRQRGEPPRKKAKRNLEGEEEGGEVEKGVEVIQEGEVQIEKEGDTDQPPERSPQSRKEMMKQKEERRKVWRLKKALGEKNKQERARKKRGKMGR